MGFGVLLDEREREEIERESIHVVRGREKVIA